MPENKTVPIEADVPSYIASIENDRRREDAGVVLAMMRDVTGVEPKMWGGSIVGFGEYGYKYESGRQGTMFATGFAPRKSSLVLYIMSGFPRHEELMKRLGKYKTGKSCLYINKLDDVELGVLRELVERSAAHVAENSYDPGSK